MQNDPHSQNAKTLESDFGQIRPDAHFIRQNAVVDEDFGDVLDVNLFADFAVGGDQLHEVVGPLDVQVLFEEGFVVRDAAGHVFLELDDRVEDYFGHGFLRFRSVQGQGVGFWLFPIYWGEVVLGVFYICYVFLLPLPRMVPLRLVVKILRC